MSCAGQANKILEAMPAAFAGWDAMTDERLLESLKPSAATVDAVRDVLQNQVGALRKREVSWAAIGDALGISRQAAWECFILSPVTLEAQVVANRRRQIASTPIAVLFGSNLIIILDATDTAVQNLA